MKIENIIKYRVKAYTLLETENHTSKAFLCKNVILSF